MTPAYGSEPLRGDMTDRITLARDVTEIGAGGRSERRFETVATVFASVKRKTGSPVSEAGHLRHPQAIEFSCSFQDEILDTDRILYRGRSYAVLSAREVGRFAKTAIFTCEADGTALSEGVV